MLKGLGFDRWTAQEQFQRQDKQCCSLQWSRYQCAGAVVMQLGLLSFCLFAAKIVVRGGLVSNRWVPETQRKHLALTICTTIIRYNNGEINICYFESSGAHGMDDCRRGMTQAKISEVIRTRAVTQERNRTNIFFYLVGHRRQRDGVQLCTTNNHHIIRNQKWSNICKIKKIIPGFEILCSSLSFLS